MANVPILKTICNEEFKKKVSQFCKKKGLTEAAIIRKAIKNYIDNESREANS